MKTIVIYWGALIIAYGIAKRSKDKEKMSRLTGGALNVVMYLLILLMSLRMGANKAVIDSLAEIGIQSLIITAITIAGSMLAVTVTRWMMHLDRKGNKKSGGAANEKEETSGSSAKAGEGLRSSLVIMALVATGMIAGYLLIYRKLGIQDNFLLKSDLWMTILLVALIFVVGFSLGL